ncbi:MAG: YmdB family metallophosphoesterase [Spirochaetales bacterium]|nr:MAG: YmdB family metallophosphoesterase [Spirochaetales bacterium]
MSIRILCIGEIVGKSGVFTVKSLLPAVKKQYNIDFVIANGEGATGGYGIGKNHAIYLKKLGIDVLTSGERIYYKMDMVQFIANASFILRPANYPQGNPGRGWWIYEKNQVKIGIINALGQSGFNRTHLTNPYVLIPDIINRIKKETDVIIVDFHATTTAEKQSMFYHLDGKVSAVVGTHFKTQTADETVLPGGTAVITDLGRAGSLESVGGLDPKVEIQKLVTQIPERSKDCWEALELQGVVLEIDESGKALSIERLRVPCEEEFHEREGDSNRDNGSED